MKIYDFEQNTEEWYAARLGKVTASSFAQAIAGGAGKTKSTLMRKLIAERLTGQPAESYSNSAMGRGHEIEPLAREYYELINDVNVQHVGFVEYSEYIGCSPDGLVGDDGLLEIKCPNSATHIEYILANKLPSTYKAQVHGQLWVTDRQWCDFMSYDPRMSVKQAFIIRVERDEKYISELRLKLESFIADMNNKIEQITASEF